MLKKIADKAPNENELRRRNAYFLAMLFALCAIHGIAHWGFGFAEGRAIALAFGGSAMLVYIGLVLLRGKEGDITRTPDGASWGLFAVRVLGLLIYISGGATAFLGIGLSFLWMYGAMRAIY